MTWVIFLLLIIGNRDLIDCFPFKRYKVLLSSVIDKPFRLLNESEVN